MNTFYKKRKLIFHVLLVVILTSVPFIIVGFCDLDHEIRRLQTPVPELRLDASRNILQCVTKGDNYYVEPLIDILDNENNPRISANLISALGRISDDKACETVIGYAEHKNPVVRNAVAQSLGQLDCDDGCEILIDLLDDDVQLVRGHSAFSLVLFGEDCKKELRKLLKNKKASVSQRSYASIILGDMGDISSFYTLMKIAAKEKPKWLSNSAKEGLMRLISWSLKQNRYGTIRDKLIKYLNYDSDGIVSLSIVMLGNLGEKDALDKLEEIKDDEEWSKDVRRQATYAIEKINKSSK